MATVQFVSGTPDWAKPKIIAASNKYGVPTAILSAQIKQESGFNPVARGLNKDPKTGAIRSTDRGIAQINDYWHPEISNAQADNPDFAIDWMARNISGNYKKTGSWAQALSIYNSGSPTGTIGTYAAKILSAAGSPTAEDTELALKSSPQIAGASATLRPQELVSPRPGPTFQPAPIRTQAAQTTRIPSPFLYGNILNMYRQDQSQPSQKPATQTPVISSQDVSTMGTSEMPALTPQTLPPSALVKPNV